MSEIEQAMAELKMLRTVPILLQEVGQDVRLHVSQFISESRTMKDWPEDLKAEVEEVVSSGAQGM